MIHDDEETSLSLRQEPPRVEGGVYDLNDETFIPFLKKHHRAIINFYAPWCSHCQQLEPEFAKAALLVANMTTDVAKDLVFARINAATNVRARRVANVKGYPTIMASVSRVLVPYAGERNAGSMTAELPELAVDPIKTFSTGEDFTRWSGKFPGLPRLVFFGPKTAPGFYDFYLAASHLKTLGVPCGQLTDEDAGFEQGYIEGQIVLYRASRYVADSALEGKLELPFFSTYASKDALVDFVLEKGLPLVADITKATQGLYLARKLPIVVLVVPNDECGWFTKAYANKTQKTLEAVRKVARHFIGVLSFVITTDNVRLAVLIRWAHLTPLFPVAPSLHCPVILRYREGAGSREQEVAQPICDSKQSQHSTV